MADAVRNRRPRIRGPGWGSNAYGQSNPPTGTYKTVTAGDRHSCALRTDNTITCWG